MSGKLRILEVLLQPTCNFLGLEGSINFLITLHKDEFSTLYEMEKQAKFQPVINLEVVPFFTFLSSGRNFRRFNLFFKQCLLFSYLAEIWSSFPFHIVNKI